MKARPAPTVDVPRPCGCKLRVRLPGDGRLIPCWAGTFCKVHPHGHGAWPEIVKADHTALVEVPGMWWKREPLLVAVVPVAAAPEAPRPARVVAPPRAPVMPLFMRGVS